MESDASFPSDSTFLENTLIHVYFISIPHLTLHYCSLLHPCRCAIPIISPFLNLRLVCSTWNNAVERLRNSTDWAYFNRIEDAYYPHAWHINTRVRRAALLGRYRIYRTIDSEAGDRGVYLAHNFGGPRGCMHADQVAVKCWTSESDNECLSEQRSYSAFCSGTVPITGLPTLLASKYDNICAVYAIVMQKLGPSLEDLREILPAGRFDQKMVLAVAIQMLDRYRDIHARGVIHNGVKPGNILLSPPPDKPTHSDPTLYAIDFGLSFPLDLTTKHPLPGRTDVVGNRRFLSMLAHLGISQSQRDDLESLAYLLSYLFHGSLPWDHPSCDSNVPSVWRIKASTSGSILFSRMDEVFIEYWKDVRSLAFGEVPDYDRMKRRFEACWRSRGFGGREGEVDWHGVWEGLLKAQKDRSEYGHHLQLERVERHAAASVLHPSGLVARTRLSILSPVSTFRSIVSIKSMLISTEQDPHTLSVTSSIIPAT